MGTHRLPRTPQSPLTGVSKVGVPGAQPFIVGAPLAYVPLHAPPITVAPPIMPPLPATPPANPWLAKMTPSAHIVQKQYVDLRMEELQVSRIPGRQTALATLEQYLLDRLDPTKKRKNIPPKELLRIYHEIERNLQSAELTINFHSDVWFTNENPYDTYTQMYERAMEGNRMVLRDAGLNSAEARALADNQITFPSDWQDTQTTTGRGLSPGRQRAGRLMRQMDTGDLVPRAPGEKAFYASNRHFNPKTKQIFLGLNYGRRPHGSARNFGWSYFVLRNKLKPRCIFYAGDTFMQLHQGTHAGNLQVPYGNLGALFGQSQGGDFMLRDAIFKSCYEGKALPDPDDQGWCKFYLVEAHHFGELNFRDHVKYLVISPTGLSDLSLWPTIVDNARKFAQKHDFKLFQTS